MTRRAALPPGPAGKLVLGNLVPFRRDLLGFLTDCAKEHGDVAGFRLGPHRFALLSHPDHIEEVLVHQNRNFLKHYVTRLLRPVLGNGLLLSEKETWLRQRRIMQPAFHPQQVAKYGDVIVEETERTLSDWQSDEPRELSHEMMRLTLAIIARAVLDVQLGSERDEIDQAMEVILTDFRRRFDSVFPVPVRIPTPRNRKLRGAIRGLETIVDRIISDRQHAAADRNDLLSRLLGGDEQMSPAQLRDELITLLLAGHETTANALVWTFVLLSQHPDVEEKLRRELNDELQDQTVTVDDLPRLAYTKCVIQESMRLFPPVYAFGREAISDCEIGGYRIPAKTSILISQWVTHRDSRWFSDPEAFRPDRFEPALVEQLPKYAYFPFGGGPRVCIGNSFALTEMTLVLATIVRRFRVELADDSPIQPWPSATLRPGRAVTFRAVSAQSIAQKQCH